MARASKSWGWLFLLWALASVSSHGSAPGIFSPAQPVPPRKPPPRRRNPFPPQPEPTDADLEVPPSDMRYPLYADLLWIQFAERAERSGPRPSVTDLTAARVLTTRTLTEFERWALKPFVPPGFDGALLEELQSASPAPRFHRWSLAKTAYDLARKKGAPESMARQLQQRVGRGLYNQARDFYRAKS